MFPADWETAKARFGLVLSRLRKSVREDRGVARNPNARKLFGPVEAAHLTEKTWASTNPK